MELTNLRHDLKIAGTTHEIDEPVGFDSLKIVIKRGDFHGMSIAASDTELEFYDSNLFKAATLIQTAYESDIETEIEYTAKDRTTGEIAYQGKLDLSTYNENRGNYFSVRCQVGEISEKTTFNNRIETEVDLNSNDTLDGTPLTHSYPWMPITIPPKTIIYTNRVSQKELYGIDESTSPTGRYHLGAGKPYQFIGIQLNDRTDLAEFGDFTIGLADIASDITVPAGETYENLYLLDYYQPIYSKGDETAFYAKFGLQDYTVDIDLQVALNPQEKLFDDANRQSGSTILYPRDLYFTAKLVLIDGATTFEDAMLHPLAESAEIQISNSNVGGSVLFSLQDTLTGIDPNHLILGFILRSEAKDEASNVPGTLTPAPGRVLDAKMRVYNLVESTGYIEMKLNSKREEPVTADTLLVHEAANKIAEMISEQALTVQSDYYSRHDSPVNPKTRDAATGVGLGDGALKAITNGYKIRGLAATNGIDRSMPLSFKKLIQALNCIDCIGWGFSEESGTTKIRVEPWHWFYKNTTTLAITSPNGMTRSIDENRIVTALNIGYKKYTESDEINSADTIHGERSLNSNSKIMTREVEALCDFIADNYAIEETRRKAYTSETSDWKYDDKTFVLELKAEKTSDTPAQLRYHGSNDSIAPASYSYDINMLNPEECYNLRISPRRNAGRWRQYMAQYNSSRDFAFVTGKMNCAAFYIPRPNGTNPNDGKYYFYHATPTDTYYENGAVQNTGAITKKELVTLTYPLTQTEWNALKAAPYGLIEVDGVDFWLQEAKYEIKTGKTELTLIPKA